MRNSSKVKCLSSFKRRIIIAHWLHLFVWNARRRYGFIQFWTWINCSKGFTKYFSCRRASNFVIRFWIQFWMGMKGIENYDYWSKSTYHCSLFYFSKYITTLVLVNLLSHEHLFSTVASENIDIKMSYFISLFKKTQCACWKKGKIDFSV